MPQRDKKIIKLNRKKNMFFLLSALAYFCLSMDNKVGYVIGLVAAMGIAFVAAGQVPPLWDILKEDSRKCKLFYGLTAAGICLGAESYFRRQTAKLMMPQLEGIFLITGIIGAVAAFLFIYLWVRCFWKLFAKAAAGLIQDLTGVEKITGSLLFAALSGLVIFAFSQSEVFSGTEHLHALTELEFLYDLIYTSDTAALQHENAFFALTHPQNDLRQPLFAVFSAPLLGISYLLGRVISGSEIVHMILLNLPQLALLLAANWMVAKTMGLEPGKRICFLVLSTCMYSNLLFSLMMEQYVVAYFWLAFSIYQICRKGRADAFVVYGAGGTLLTTMVLMPALSDKHPVKQFKAWFGDMMKYGLGFVGLMLAFARFDIFTSLFKRVGEFLGYTDSGKHVVGLTFFDKVCQYTEFVKNCFAQPNADTNVTFLPFPTWQLTPITALNLVGIGILILCVCSAVWNRKNVSSRMAAFWAAFSVAMLLILGWGTRENGLILYSLYFGWAFLVLLFQLAEKIGEVLRFRYFSVICSVIAAVGLLFFNIPAIRDLIRFAITYYPA